jgi:hypothetical protein
MASLVKRANAQCVWTIDRIVHFEPGDFVRDGLTHFGFRDTRGRLFGIDHPRHFLGLVREGGRVEWTVAEHEVFPGVPNVEAPLSFPMYVDLLPDGSPIVSNFGSAQLFRVDVHELRAELLVEGHELGMPDMGNCVVDREGCIWVNEVRGSRVWRFAPDGRPIRTVDGFGWIYDIRRGRSGELVVLDSGNFALRVVDPDGYAVRTVAEGFASDPTATFDGPISLAVDEHGKAYVGDRHAHVVREVDLVTGAMTTIAGRADVEARHNPVSLRDPLRLNLPEISSMDYARGHLYVPTDLDGDKGDLAVLRRV